MALNKKENLIVEAMKSLLQQDAKLGLVVHDDVPERSHFFQHLHEQINEMFDLKAAGLTHFEGVCAAFRKVHNYKYVDDPTFEEAMGKEMTAQGIPANEREAAAGIMQAVISELREEQKAWGEKDAGFSPDLDDIKELSKPEQHEQ